MTLSFQTVSKPHVAGLKNRYVFAGCLIKKNPIIMASLLRGHNNELTLNRKRECAIIELMQRGMELIPPRGLFIVTWKKSTAADQKQEKAKKKGLEKKMTTITVIFCYKKKKPCPL